MLICNKQINFIFDSEDLKNLTKSIVGIDNLTNNQNKADLSIVYHLRSSIDNDIFSMLAKYQNEITDSNVLMGSSILINELGDYYNEYNSSGLRLLEKESGTYGYKQDYFFYIFDYNKNICFFYYTEQIFEIVAVYTTILKRILAKFYANMDIFPIHASAVSKNNNGVLILAPSGGGKTTTAINLCINYHYNLLNDDMNFVLGENLFSINWAIKAHKDLCTKYALKVCHNELAYDKEVLIDPSDSKIKYIADCKIRYIICLSKNNLSQLEFSKIDKISLVKNILESNLNWYSVYQRKNAYKALYNLTNIPSYEIKYSLENLFQLPTIINHLCGKNE